MKRVAFLCMTAFLALTLCGCAQGSGETVYDTLNELMEIGYSDIQIEVVTRHDGESLTANYNLKSNGDNYKISYSYERLSLIEAGDGDIIVPENRKTAYKGSVSVAEGNITSTEGDPLDLPLGFFWVKDFDFSKDNFTAVSERDGTFSAEVVHSDAFSACLAQAENMKVNATYSSEAMKSLTISYRAFRTDTVLTYRFEV